MRKELTKSQWLARQLRLGKRSFSKRIRTETVFKMSGHGQAITGTKAAVNAALREMAELSDEDEKTKYIDFEPASPNGLPVNAIALQDGEIDKPKGTPRLFAVVRFVHQRDLRRWSERTGIRIGKPIDIDHLGYVKCAAYEIFGNGTSLKLHDGWIVELWHSIPKQKLSS